MSFLVNNDPRAIISIQGNRLIFRLLIDRTSDQTIDSVIEFCLVVFHQSERLGLRYDAVV